VKLTGGEPTLRRDIVDIVGATSEIFAEVRLITNGWNLAKTARHLAAAGLSMVELSIDSLDARGFDDVTQTRQWLPKVLAGLESCLDVGIEVQINMVVMRQNLDQINPMIDLIATRGPIRLKLLELVYYQYPGLDYWKDNFVEMREIIPRLAERASDVTWETPPGAFGTPMRVYQLQNGSSIVVKDGRLGAVYADVCDGCPLFPCQDGLYGLSLTSDGMLKMCKHRPDLHVKVPGRSVEEAVAEVIHRYDSAYFLANGWEPGTTESRNETHIVPPDDAVLRWYRRSRSLAVAKSPVGARPETIPAEQTVSEPRVRPSDNIGITIVGGSGA
jgi:cyclic pyranopterin phosphate synthase